MAVTAAVRLLHGLNIPVHSYSRVRGVLSIPHSVENRLSIFKRINDSVDALIPISPWYEKLLLANGFSPDKLRQIRTSAGSKPGPGKIRADNSQPLRVVFAGRQTRAKGLHLLLQALSTFAPGLIELHLFGAVSEPIFQERIAQLQTRGYIIHQHGEVAHATLTTYLREMDVLCLPSTCVEMAPLVIQEAFAAGIPAIGSDLGGISDAIVDGVNGFRFRQGDFRDLVEKLKLLVGNRLLVEQLKRSCLDSLRVTDIGGLHLQLYYELKTKKNSKEI
jgi:glycosyltransferase involved in cell wall biosynthesis